MSQRTGLNFFNVKTEVIIKKWLGISVIIGILSGLLMSIFLYFIQTMTDVLANYDWFIPIAVLLAGLFTALLSKYGYKEVEGPGIDHIIELKNKQMDIPSRSIVTRFLSSGLSLGSNMPGGREAPAFMIGGALAYALGKKMKLSKEDLSLCVTIGSASATSAIFSAPLGGTLFASEVPFRRDIDMDIYLPAFIASIVSVITFFLLGKQILGVQGLNIVTSSHPGLIELRWVVLSLIFGAVIGITSYLYIKLYLLCKIAFNKFGETWKQIVVASFLGAFVIALSGIFFPHRTEFLETGFTLLNSISRDINSYDLVFLLILLVIKASIILFLISGGNSIGIFSPSLVLGGIVGIMFAILLGMLQFASVFFVLGMVGTLAGTAKTPISSMILILEMTGLPQMILYMAIVSSVAYVLSGETGLYRNQLVDRKEALKQIIESKNYLSVVPIESIMATTVFSVSPTTTVEKAKDLFIKTNRHTVPVLDLNFELVGVISYNDIKSKDDSTLIGEVMVKNVLYLPSNYSLQHALQEVLRSGIEHFPVVEDDSKKVIGFVTLRDILKAYFEQESAKRKYN